jgi:hypothetical protein
VTQSVDSYKARAATVAAVPATVSDSRPISGGIHGHISEFGQKMTLIAILFV